MERSIWSIIRDVCRERDVGEKITYWEVLSAVLRLYPRKFKEKTIRFYLQLMVTIGVLERAGDKRFIVRYRTGRGVTSHRLRQYFNNLKRHERKGKKEAY